MLNTSSFIPNSSLNNPSSIAIGNNGNYLYVSNNVSNNGSVAKFDANTGNEISANFISINSPGAISVYNNNLFVCYLPSNSYNQSIGQYNVSGTTPRPISNINNVPSTITSSIAATDISGVLHLYCASFDSHGVVSVDYTLIQQPIVNNSFIQNLYNLNLVAAYKNYLYLPNTILNTNTNTNTNIVSKYNASTGMEISGNFINLRSSFPLAIAISNDGNYLYIGIENTIRVYDANTGNEISGKIINISNGTVIGIAISNKYLYALVEFIQNDNKTETISYSVNKYNVYSQSQTVSGLYKITSVGVDRETGLNVTSNATYSATASGDNQKSALAELNNYASANFIQEIISGFSTSYNNAKYVIELDIE